jgi:Trp operon repressor/predicted ATP-dependent serine protease
MQQVLAMRNTYPKLTHTTEAGDIPDMLRPMRRKSVSMSEFMQKDFPNEEPLLGAVITHGSTGMLSAQRGLGKSLLVLHIAYAVAGRKVLPPWGCGSGGVVVYLDGEMKARTLKERLRQIANRDSHASSQKRVEQNLEIINRDDFKHVIGYIDKEDDQAFIESMLPPDCRLLIVDNLSAWTSSAREDGTAFAPIKRWLTHLRTKGIAVLLIHHTGKNGSGQRGTSIHEDMLDYSILLTESKGRKPKNGTSFILKHTKVREFVPDLPEMCRYTFTTDPVTDVMEHHYEDDETQTASEQEKKVLELLKQGMSGKEIAESLDVSASVVSRVLTSLPDEMRAEIKAAQALRASSKKAAGDHT